MIGGGLLSGIGMFGQARAGRRAQRQMNRLASGVQGQYDAALAPLGGLLTELQGQNTRAMALQDARMAGFGFDRGTKEESDAFRLAGRNTYGRMTGVEQIRQQAALGQAALGALSSRTQQNLAARMGVAQSMAQGQMRGVDMANQIALGGIQAGLQGAQQTYENISQLGGFGLGAGIQGAMAPNPTVSSSPSSTAMPGLAQALGVDYGTLASRFRFGG